MVSPRHKIAALLLMAAGVILLLHAYTNSRYSPSSSSSPSTSLRQHVRASDPCRLDADDRTRRRYNAVATEYEPCLGQMLDDIVRERRPADDPLVLQVVSAMLEPPSTHMIKTVRPIVETVQSKAVNKILGDMRKGFYIEVGGLDGERGSNTLWLENNRQWQGLLIEMDPYFYTQLKGHSRKAWTINCCLSPYNYTIKMDFKESNGGGGQLVDPDNPAKNNDAVRKGAISRVPCFPLASLMLALKQTRVDYFSLDVEGFELDILRTVPFEQLDVRTFSVEFVHGRAGKQAYLDFMQARGYRMEKEIHAHNSQMAVHVDDFIFVKDTVKT